MKRKRKKENTKKKLRKRNKGKYKDNYKCTEEQLLTDMKSLQIWKEKIFKNQFP